MELSQYDHEKKTLVRWTELVLIIIIIVMTFLLTLPLLPLVIKGNAKVRNLYIELYKSRPVSVATTHALSVIYNE